MKIALWLSVLVAIGWTSSFLLDDGSVELGLAPEVASESPWRREWRAWPGTAARSHEYGAETSIVMDFEVSRRTGELFALAMPEGRLGRLSLDGTVGAEAEVTSGPGFPIDLEVDSEDRVLVLIAKENRLVRLTGDLAAIDSLPLGEPATRVATLAEGGFVTLSQSSGDHLFCRYDARGRLERCFGEVLAGGSQPPLVVQGWIFGGGTGGFSYAPLYLGVLAAFDEAAQARFMTLAVGPRHVPRATVEEGLLQVEPGSPFRSMDLTATGARIIVLSESSSRREGRVLDFYRSGDGGYLFSCRLPNRPKAIAVAGDRFFTAEGNRLTEWSLPVDVDEL